MQPVYKKYLTTMVLIWAASFLLLSLFYIFLIIPLRKKTVAANYRLIEYRQQQELTRETDVEAVIAGWHSRMEKLKGRFADFITEFEDSSNLPFAISRILSDVGVSSTASIESSPQSYSEIQNSEHLARINNKVHFSATFNQFAQVINRLERHKPVFFVNNFTISRPRKAGSEKNQDVSMDLNSLVRKSVEDEEAAKSIKNQDLSASNSTSGPVYSDVR